MKQLTYVDMRMQCYFWPTPHHTATYIASWHQDPTSMCAVFDTKIELTMLGFVWAAPNCLGLHQCLRYLTPRLDLWPLTQRPQDETNVISITLLLATCNASTYKWQTLTKDSHSIVAHDVNNPLTPLRMPMYLHCVTSWLPVSKPTLEDLTKRNIKP